MTKLLRILTLIFCGTGWIAQAQETVKTVDTVADLISRPASGKGTVRTLGRTTVNDGGGAEFYFEAGSSTTTNRGTVFASSTPSGRWKAVIRNGEVNVRMFGAKADGTDDSTAFQSALDWRDPATGRPGTVLVPPGTYRVSGLVMTGGRLKGVGNVERGTDVATKTASILEHTLGATADLLTVNAQNAGGGPSAIIEDILFLGHPEYNLRDAMAITAVYSGDRLHFDVASAPSIEGAKGSHPYLGFGALFTDENRYLGTFMLQSFITNGAGGSSTNTVNIATGTDAYATVSGEDVLRTGFKVCFPKSTTWYSNGSSMGARSFSHMAGYSAIVLWDADECLIRNVKCVNWHTGVAVDSESYVVEGLETYNCHLSGLIAEPFGFLADATVSGFVLLNGRYQLDDALVPATHTLKNTVYRYSAVGFGALGAQAKVDNVVAGPSALYGAFLYGGTHSHINNLLIEAPSGVPLFAPIGNSVSPQAATSIGRLRVLSGYASDSLPDNRRTDLAIVEINTQASAINIAQASVAPFTLSGNSTNWTWAFWYKWPSTSTDTQLGIGQYHDPYQMVPRGSMKPGGSYNAQRWQMMGGSTVVGGAATEPIMVWQRDVAEPNANKVGITYSGGAKLLFAHNGDGIVDDVGYTLESTTSATQLTLGNLSGTVSPRTAIVQGEPASGTDVSGGSTHLRSGTGAGAGSNSSIQFYTPTVGSSGSSAQTQTLRLTLGQGGQLTFAGLTADPSVGTVTGSIYYNSASNSFRWHNGTSWANLGSGGGGGSGDVVGPASSTDNAVVRFDGTTGKLVQDSAVTIADTTGDITAGKYNKVTVTAPATGSTLTISDGKTLTVNNSLTLSGTDSTVMTFPSTSATIARTDASQTFSGTQTMGGGLMYVGSSVGTAPYIFSFSGNSDTTPNAAGLGLTLYSYAVGNTEYGLSLRGSAITATSGDSRAVQVARSFTPTSGTATWSQMSIQPTVNQTGGANGITRGLFINPVITAAADFRSLEVASGKSLFSGDVQLGSSSTLNWNADTYLIRNGANNIALRNGTTAQRFDVSNTYTDASNYEVGSIWWTGNTLVIGTDKLGTGSSRAISFMIGGAYKWQIDTAFKLLPLGGNYDIGSSSQRCGAGYFLSGLAIGASGSDVNVTAESLGVIQFGTDAATPTAQTIKSHDGSGTDKDGAKLTRAGGKSTGAGRGGDLIDQTSLSGTTGASANSYSTRTYQSAKPVDLTEGAATQLFTVTVGTGKYLGLQMVSTVNASDGTDFQAQTSTITFSVVNKAGTIALGTVQQTDSAAVVSAGTLTPVTYTITDNGSGVLGVKCNATSSLAQTILRAKWQIDAINSDDVATVTPN